MEIVITFLVIVAAALGFAYLGMRYGRAVEQEAVARVLAEQGKVDSATLGAVGRILGTLKRDYTRVYIDILAEFDKIKKAL